MMQMDVLCYIQNIFGFRYSYNKTRLTHDFDKNFDRSWKHIYLQIIRYLLQAYLIGMSEKFK